jgi:hypothetical protein
VVAEYASKPAKSPDFQEVGNESEFDHDARRRQNRQNALQLSLHAAIGEKDFKAGVAKIVMIQRLSCRSDGELFAEDFFHVADFAQAKPVTCDQPRRVRLDANV